MTEKGPCLTALSASRTSLASAASYALSPAATFDLMRASTMGSRSQVRGNLTLGVLDGSAVGVVTSARVGEAAGRDGGVGAHAASNAKKISPIGSRRLIIGIPPRIV